MREKPILLSALVFSGILALNAGTVWSQSSDSQSGPSSSGGTQSGQSGGAQGSGSGTGSETDKSEMSGQWSSEEIKEVQQALKEKGHDPGAIDGVMSSQTQQAIRAFQQKNGLQATGTLNAETAAALGVSPSGAGGKSSSGASGGSSTGESGKGSYDPSGSGSSSK